jgi:integrase
MGTNTGTREHEMAGERLLSEAQCKAARASSRLFYLNDGGGLRLRVRPNGSRHWIFRYRFGDLEKSTSLGPYPEVSLKAARQRLPAMRALVRDGRDPVVVRRAEKAQGVKAVQSTFGAVAREWLQHNQASWSPHHYERNEGLVRRYLLPALDGLPITLIAEPYLFQVLKKVYDSGIQESARRTRSVAAQIFSYGRATHQCTGNPARDMADNPYFKKPAVKHFKALPQADVPDLLVALAARGAKQKLSLTTIGGILMVLYTGQREFSVRAARWAEIDFEKGLWTIPAERMKSRREHVVPIPRQLDAILREVEPLTYRGPESFIFSSRSKTGHLAENTLRLALHRSGFPVTIHGMRSLITVVLNENGFNPDWVEKQLDHQEKNQVRAAYLRTKFLDQRVTMMQWFADWCSRAHGRRNVVRLRERNRV